MWRARNSLPAVKRQLAAEALAMKRPQFDQALERGANLEKEVRNLQFPASGSSRCRRKSVVLNNKPSLRLQ